MKLNNSKSVGMAVWGLGAHAKKNLLPAIQRSVLFDLVGVCTREPKRAKEIIDQYNIIAWHNFEEMLSDPRVDCVYLSTPIGLHFGQAEKILMAGKHLLCEKSLTNDYKASLSLANLAEKKRLAICEAFMYQYHPQFLRVLEIVNREAFGRVLSINAHFGIPNKIPPGFRSQKELGGGAFWDVACYLFSAVMNLLEIYPKRISTFLDNQNQKVDMSGAAILNFTPTQHAYLNWGYNRAYQANLSVWGEHQSLYTDRIFSKEDDYIPKITLKNRNGRPEVITCKAANSFVDMLAIFYQAIFDNQISQQLCSEIKRQARLMKQAIQSTVPI